jgi:hypothetical protein
MDDCKAGVVSAGEIPIHQVVDRIETLNRDLASFWKNAHGWAPVEAAGLLSKSRLDWQVPLSSSLRLWLRVRPEGIVIDGQEEFQRAFDQAAQIYPR